MVTEFVAGKSACCEREYLYWAVNVLTNSPNILGPTMQGFSSSINPKFMEK